MYLLFKVTTTVDIPSGTLIKGNGNWLSLYQYSYSIELAFAPFDFFVYGHANQSLSLLGMRFLQWKSGLTSTIKLTTVTSFDIISFVILYSLSHNYKSIYCVFPCYLKIGFRLFPVTDPMLTRRVILGNLFLSSLEQKTLKFIIYT